MKQILQDLTKGTTSIVHAPTPQVSLGHVLIHTSVSLISVGTERMLVDFGKASYFKKARQQPEKVKQVLEKIKTDGLHTTWDAIRFKLAEPLALGYCNVGVVAEVGTDVDGFKPGDRVVSNGPHADVVHVPKNLCVRIPSNVSDDAAAFTVVASIGLQGIRLVEPTLGEAVVVIGVGLIGLLTVQLLKAQGCRVLAIDLDERKLALARAFGAVTCNPSLGDDPIAAGMVFSRGYGVDAVIITASTSSNDPVTQAARMSRKRGRIVLVGVTGLELNRADFYEKELSFQVSCSYGPGRYDTAYEKQGHDYPIGFVRWTEQRNFEACLDMLSSRQLDVQSLISHQFRFEEASQAYDVLTEDKSTLGILLHYSSESAERAVQAIQWQSDSHFSPSKPSIGFVGAGNYVSRMLIPAFKRNRAQLHTIVTARGITGVIHGKKAGFIKVSTDVDVLLMDKAVNTVVIGTRHDTHADLVVRAFHAGKHVFVEKPLALNLDELSQVESAYHTAIMSGKKLQFMIGFNRRFAPHTQKMKQLLDSLKEPKSFVMTMNASAVPLDHWTQNHLIGGGRIIGEVCHYVDLMRYLAGSEITTIHAQCLTGQSSRVVTEDKVTIMLGFADGSVGTIHYLANGVASFPKERIEVFTTGRVLQLDNFRILRGFGWPTFKRMKLWRQDKGQQECVKQFLLAIEQGSKPLIAIQDIFEVTKLCIQARAMVYSNGEVEGCL